MKIKINREQPFQVLATNFSIGPSSSGYDLQISADGVNYTTLFSVGANVTRMVTGVANGSYYKLAGNTDEDVIVNWFRQCDDGQGGGGGGAGSQGPMGPQGPQGPSNSGYKISLSTHSYENYTEEDIAAINTFLAAVSADSATLNGAYVVVEGNDYFYLSRYEENGFMLFGDVNNGFIHSIAWEFDPETAEITGGEYVVNTIPEGGNEPAFGLKAVETLGTNWDNPEAGDVQAHFSAYTETQEVSGTYDDGLDTGDILITRIICNEDIDGTIFAYDGGTWEIGWDGTGITLTLVEGVDNITGVYTIVEKGDASDGGYDFSLVDGNDGIHFDIFVEKNFEINNTSLIGGEDVSFAEGFSIPTGITGEYTGYTTETKHIADGVWQYKENPEWGRWIGNSGTIGIGDENYGGTFLVYDYWPFTGATKICKLSRVATDSGKYLYYIDGHFKTFSTDDPTGTAIDEIFANTEATISNVGIGNYKVFWDTNNKFIRFTAQYNGLYEPVSTTLSGYGWESVVKNETIKFKTNDAIIDGIPKWTNEGRIVGRTTSYQTKNIYINNNGYFNSLTVLTNGSNGGSFSRIFTPDNGGTEGQVLTSTGNGAPVWATLIKAVQITSDAYDALVQAGTTDPNTLYLIVDE